MKKFTYLKILNSPFKPFKLKWYIGKTRIGTPYFLPRKWVKATPELARKATLEYIEREENFNKLNPNYARKIRPYDEVYQEKLRYEYPVPLKVGFSSCDLGWKTKWSDTDYRYEWSPVFSFVFFGYQIALMVLAPDSDSDHSYWECWLYYYRNTDKTKSKKERIEQCMKEFPQTWTIYHKKPTEYTETVNKYKNILKNKYKPNN